MDKKYKILVLGGTGAIGHNLVYELMNCECHVYVTSRKSKNNLDNITYIQGNAMDISFLESILKGNHWDCIIDFMAYTYKQFENRYELLLHSTEHYIFLSSARVYCYDATEINEESKRLLDVCKDSRYLHTQDYALEKAREENLLTNSQYKNWTILRPYKTYSSNRLQLGFLEKESWLYRAIHGRPIVFSKDLADKFTVLSDTADVAKCIREIVFKSETKGEVFQVITDKEVKWETVLKHYIDILEKELGFKINVVYGKDAYTIWRGKPDYTIKYDSLKNHCFNNSKLLILMNDASNNSFNTYKEGLQRCVSDFMLNPSFKSIDWMQEGNFDRIAGTKTSLNEINGNLNKLKYFCARYTVAFSIFKLVRKGICGI